MGNQPRKAIKELRFLWRRGILKKGQKIPSMPASWLFKASVWFLGWGWLVLNLLSFFPEKGGILMSRLGWTPTMHQSYLWVIHPKRPKGFNLAFGRFGDLVSSYPLYMSFLYCLYMCKQIDIVPVLNHSTSCSRKMRSIPPCTLVKSCQSNFGHSDRAVQRQCPEKKGIFVMRFCCHRPVGECELFFRFFHIQLVSF